MRIFGPTAGPLGSPILGEYEENDRRRRIRVQLLLTTMLVGANAIGAAVVITLVAFVVPGPFVFAPRLWMINFIAVPVYMVVALIVGITWGTRSQLRALRWSIVGAAPTPRDQKAVLSAPARLTLQQGALWFVAFGVFTFLYGLAEPRLIPKVAFTVLFGGAVVCANSYLLSEFALRPTAARALQAGPPPRRLRAGITTRMVLAWTLGSGVPVVGMMIIAIYALVEGDMSGTQIAVPMLSLGGVTLGAGFLLMRLMAASTVAPVRTVSTAIERVARGDLSTRVVVFDGTELGQLQAGFNEMADGLRERERLRDVFGQHVGREVAREALRRPAELGGEERDVAVIFIDMIGSTTIAASHPPTEVVMLLNRFFGVVVGEVDRLGGFVNKFVGDAALVVFGAPTDIDDAPGRALAAARAIMTRLELEVPECQAAVGITAGVAVAGNLGSDERFEYTVIGDPVNAAARLCELAKSVSGRVLSSEETVAAARPNEAERWALGEAVTLRGRLHPTTLAFPVPSPDQTT